MRTGRLLNTFSAVGIITYNFLFSGIAPYIDCIDIPKTIIILVVVTLILPNLIGPKINHTLIMDITDSLKREKSSPGTPLERTQLLEKLASCPKKIFLEVLVISTLTLLATICFLCFCFHLPLTLIPYWTATSFFGSFIEALVAYTFTEQVCSHYAKQLVQQGLDQEAFNKKQTFGLSMTARATMYILIPIVLEHLLALLVIIREKHITPLFIITNITIIAVFTIIVFQQIFRTTININNVLENTLLKKTTDFTYLPTDVNNELNYNVALINNMLSQLQSIVQQTNNSTTNLQEAIKQLSITANTTSDTSISQSASVDECLSTMYNVQKLLNNISETTSDVEHTTKATRSNLNEGFFLLKHDISENQMLQISNENLATITGIKTLSGKVDKVWEIINTIDSLAERTKIIAFNAELKADSAGEDNAENFHVIANEIRRLAATITTSTHDIKKRIKDIQETSDNLIVTSESGTQKIREISKFFSELEQTFSNLYTTSDITVETAENVKSITDSQEQTFKQINDTLQQVSAGFEQFLASTQLITNTADNLQIAATQLLLWGSAQTEDSHAKL